MAQPLLIQPSKDPGDTRPGAHFNVPLYQHVPTQDNDPLMSGFLNVISNGAYSHPGAEGAYWRGVARSFDPRTPAGAANLASILIPGRGGGKPTIDQSRLLLAIHDSTFSPVTRTPLPLHNSWNPFGHGVKDLMDLIGAPPRLPRQTVEQERFPGGPRVGNWSPRREPAERIGVSAEQGLEGTHGELGIDPDTQPTHPVTRMNLSNWGQEKLGLDPRQNLRDILTAHLQQKN